jgi:two-component system, chemotaxis family, protein-glutamate methylesterase/glutaminase
VSASLTSRVSRQHGEAPTRVMLVDDSIVVRSITERIIEHAGGFDIVASVPGASDALAYLDRGGVDVIVLDIEMPGMSGLVALPQLLAKAGNARVIILSANCDEGGPAAIEALALGAADTLLKPGRGTFAGTFGDTLVARMRALAASDVRPVAERRTGEHALAAVAPDLPSRKLSAIAIGASTGGIVAINALLGALPKRIDCPIFITQHLPGGFMSFFADQLARETGRKILVGEDGMRVADATVYLAPGEAHMRITRLSGQPHIMLDRSPSPVGACPAVDPMMASIAEVYGAHACAVMLSGMGRDGLEGIREVRRAGGLVLAQDVTSSVVWGMPGAVAREGLAEAVLDPASLGKLIVRTMQSRSGETRA